MWALEWNLEGSPVDIHLKVITSSLLEFISSKQLAVKAEVLWVSFPSIAECWWANSHADPARAGSLAVMSSKLQWPCIVQKLAFCRLSPNFSALKPIFPYSLGLCSQNFKEDVISVLFRADHLFSALCAANSLSVFTIILWKARFLYVRLRLTFIFEQKHKYLEVILLSVFYLSTRTVGWCYSHST